MKSIIATNDTNYYVIKRKSDSKFIFNLSNEFFIFDKLEGGNQKISNLKVFKEENLANEFINSHTDSWWREHFKTKLSELIILKMISSLTLFLEEPDLIQ